MFATYVRPFAIALACLAGPGAPAWAQSEILRADAACQAAAKARKIAVTGVESVRAVGSDRYDVTLRTNKDPVLCRFDAEKGSVEFPAAKPEAKADPKDERSLNARATEACAAEARRREIRLGEINAINAVGGDIDVHYLRGLLFVKPQHCRYVPSKNAAYFESVGKLPEPSPVAAAKPEKSAVANAIANPGGAAEEACLRAARERGQTKAKVLSWMPNEEGQIVVQMQAQPGGEASRCVFDPIRQTVAY